MATVDQLPELKELLDKKNVPVAESNKIMAYIQGEIKSDMGKEEKKRQVSRNTIDQLYTMIFKFWNMGLAVDGVNVVITGKGMAMVTFNGYKNKVLATYPETEFDIQLVREGDTFNVSKESGSVVYSHQINDPFDQENKPIIGAYVVFKNKRGEFIETLSRTDFDKMKDASKQSWLWGQWESEFFLKSVIKRACKRHFFDVVEEIDKIDNDQYGAGAMVPPPSDDELEKIQASVKAIEDAKDLKALNEAFQASNMMQKKDVVAAYKKRRGELDQPQITQEGSHTEESTDESS